MSLAPEKIVPSPVSDIPALVKAQHEFFRTGATKDLDFRMKQLKTFRQLLLDRETDIYRALQQDLHKVDFEAYAGELGLVLEETKSFLKNLRSWAKPKRIWVPLALMPGSAKVYPEPYGIVCVLSPWNYPIQLALSPAIGAIGAGNCVILKPSELAPATSTLIGEMISQTFPREFFAVIEGGAETTQALLKEKMDYIFFTGSPRVGKIIMQAAAEHLTPLTLELGGKSPCIVDETANLDIAARRIAWGKFFNSGQTCVAPDYLLVHPKIKDELVAKIKANLLSFYGEDPKLSPDYGRIINKMNFERVSQFLSEGRVLAGGQTDPAERYIAPTLLTDVPETARVRQEEIFGPVLPILDAGNLDEALAEISKHPRPLALYHFTTDTAREERVRREVSFGGGCVNETIAHLAVPEMPFGGVGTSGFGSYHGKASFDTFTHRKGVLKRPNFLDIKIKYPPYKGRLGILKRLIG